MVPNEYIAPVVVIIIFSVFALQYLGVFRLLKIAFISDRKKLELNRFYEKQFEYYSKLSYADKEKFIRRAYILLHTIKIEGRKGFKLGQDEKLFVLAAYVQLTFGFKRFVLNRFKRIIVYPDAYENKSTGKMHFGEVNPKGVIVLSWLNLLKGHKITDDSINLGLHEMSHALMHTIINSNDHEQGLDPIMRNIVRFSHSEMDKIKNNEKHIFREYAATNIYEFFAVAVEYFFENPQVLHNELPDLYQYIVQLLKQNPLNYK